jgi:hypothetical protein
MNERVYLKSYYLQSISYIPFTLVSTISRLEIPLHDTMFSEPYNFELISHGSLNVLLFRSASASSNLIAPILVFSNIWF